MPRLLDYVVAIYLRLVDAIVPNSIYHSHPLTGRVPAASPNVRTAIAVLALSERRYRASCGVAACPRASVAFPACGNAFRKLLANSSIIAASRVGS